MVETTTNFGYEVMFLVVGWKVMQKGKIIYCRSWVLTG
jgi:hypothetical protein